MVFIYQTGGKIPKEIVRNGLIYHHEWNAKTMAEARRIAKTRVHKFSNSKSYIKNIKYRNETVFAVYGHHSTTDRIIGGERFELMASGPGKEHIKKTANYIYKGAGFKIIPYKGGYGVWVPLKRHYRRK